MKNAQILICDHFAFCVIVNKFRDIFIDMLIKLIIYFKTDAGKIIVQYCAF